MKFKEYLKEYVDEAYLVNIMRSIGKRTNITSKELEDIVLGQVKDPDDAEDVFQSLMNKVRRDGYLSFNKNKVTVKDLHK